MSLALEGDGLICALAAILLNDCKVDVTAENISAVVNASGNKIPAYYAPVFASFIDKAGGVEKFFQSPGGGGGAAPPAASSGSGGAAAPAPKAAEKPKVEEVDALDGGMDMFGGSGGGASY